MGEYAKKRTAELMEGLYQKAREAKKNIVLPEGDDIRTLKAARMAVDKGIARIILLGGEDMKSSAKSEGISLEGITVIDPLSSSESKDYSEKFFELRKHKGITPEQAAEAVKDPMNYAAMMVHAGHADGYVSGAVHSTGDTLRPALQILKCAPGVSKVSSYFMMVVDNPDFGAKGALAFADPAFIPDPSPADLAAIAVETSKSVNKLFGIEPKVAMLSFATMNSASGPMVDAVKEAVSIAKESAPELSLDGPLQADAALVAAVGSRKCPDSNVAGKANILVFPDLNAGNIGYKLVQRLGDATPIGPITVGLSRAVNDLSRGCTAEEIFDVIAVTAVQAG